MSNPAPPPPPPPPPQFAQNYITSAQIATLAYMAELKILQPGMTGIDLKNAILATPYNAMFTTAELNAFSSRYKFLRSTSPGPGKMGGDAVAFQDLTTQNGTIAIGVAGVNDYKIPVQELLQTDMQTYLYGANGAMYSDIQKFTFDLMNDYPSSYFDLQGHSAGGQMVQLLRADSYLRGESFSSRIVTVNTFGSYGIKFSSADSILYNGFTQNLGDILKKLDEIEFSAGFVHFRNNHDIIPIFSDSQPYRLAGPAPIDLEDLLGFTDGFVPHDSMKYVNSLRLDINNQSPVISSPLGRPDIYVSADYLGISENAAEEIVVTGTRVRKDTVVVRLVGGSNATAPQVDPTTGALLPSTARLKKLADGTEAIVDKYEKNLELVFATNDDGIPVNASGIALFDADGNLRTDLEDTKPVVQQTRVVDGQGTNGKGGVTIVQQIDQQTRKPVSTSIQINGNPLPFDFSDVGGALGQQLGYRIAGNNAVLGIASSAVLQTLGDNLGDALDSLIGNQSITRANGNAFSTFGPELLTNLKSAGIGAISSFLTAELVKVLGADGFLGEALNTTAGAAIGQILSNIAGIGNPVNGIFSGLNPALIGNAIGSFLGAKLAAELVEFDTIGGQIGAAVGSAVASTAAGIAIGATNATGLAATFAQFGVAGGIAGVAIAAFVGFIVGGLIGSVFGGTPRSGADAAWNEAEGRFGVANAYARKGGSKDAAMSMADTVAQTFNAVLDATGGRLLNPAEVTTGNYGMRKSDYVYRPSSTRDKDAITFRVSSKDKDGFAKITGHGIYQGLTDSDFQIVGGSNYVKRAVYATFEMGGVTASNFDSTVLLGNISSAQSYESYLANSAVINAIVAAERDSVFAVETAINLARAVELGLTKRHRSDWFGGFGALMNEAKSNSANVAFGFDYDPFSDQVSRLITVGGFVMGDSIDIAGQTTIEAGDGNDVIILAMVTHNTDGFAVTGGAGYLANTANLKINGVVSTGGALTIDVAATVDAGGGDDVVHASNLGDNVFGGDGNDTLYGGRLDDWLLGGDGNDTLDAGTLDQAALGGDGNYLNGGDGNDILRGREGSDWLDGGDGTDTLTGGAGDDVLAGGAGAGDSVKGGTGDDQYLVRRGDGEDLAEDEVSGMPAGIGAGDAVSQRYAGIAAGSIKKNWAGSSEAIQQQKLAGGEDAMVFGQGIDIGDIQLVRSTATGGGAGNDLIVRIMQTDPETGLEGYSGTSLTVKDWFTNPFKRIEWLKFADGNEIRIGDITSFIVGGDGDEKGRTRPQQALVYAARIRIKRRTIRSRGRDHFIGPSSPRRPRSRRVGRGSSTICSAPLHRRWQAGKER
jgi:RTX calcium-binding nonapeptide repeat (4 copies)